MNLNVIDEQHPSKVAAIYEQEAAAQEAINLLVNEGGFEVEEINLIHPNDDKFGYKVEPDIKGIRGTLIKSHVVFGLLGLVVGLFCAWLLILNEYEFATSSPVMMQSAFAILGAFIGLLLAGVVSLRPDHDPLINKARHATAHNQWSVVVQTEDHKQIERARALLNRTAVSTSETL